jgi:acyl-ACP thioesterase
MVLPGKSGVMVEGTLRGNELALPGSLAVRTMENTISRQVLFSDLDVNGHMNNTRYMEWCSDLLPAAFHRGHEPREFIVCYHAEALETQLLDLHYEISDDGILNVDGWRRSDSDSAFHNRIFSAQVSYGNNIL